MGIWKTHATIEEITKMIENTMISHVGIEITEIGEDFLAGKMPVDQRTKQPYGLLHGGASCVLAETLGSIAGTLCVNMETHTCFGLNIFTNHLRIADQGYVYGKAQPVHLGFTNHVWEIQITALNDALVSVSRLTLAVLERRGQIKKS